MAIDHSRIYTDGSLKNAGHRARLRAIESTISKMGLPQTPTYFDVGCSNGYLTHRVAIAVRAGKVIGWDHSSENLANARGHYPQYEFREIDLNKPVEPGVQADLVTCFETMEHVGDISTAVENTLVLCKTGGTLLFSVPIESGFLGLAKFIVKTKLFRYSLDELSKDKQFQKKYLRALLKGESISGFRDNRDGWSTHFGFDYRDFEGLIKNQLADVSAWTNGTTRFIRIKKPAQAT